MNYRLAGAISLFFSLFLVLPLSLATTAFAADFWPFEPSLSAPPSCEAGDDTCIVITENETSQLQDLGDLNFDGILEDSRCPLDVFCVWEGQVRVGMNHRFKGGIEKFEIGLGGILSPQWTDPLTGLSVRLEQVWPERILALPRMEPYQVKLKIERKMPAQPQQEAPVEDGPEQVNEAPAKGDLNDAAQDTAAPDSPVQKGME